MATHEFQLVSPPEAERAREQWLQNAAGFILFQDMRNYAIGRIDPKLSPEARAEVLKGIDDAVYGMMMIMDGVTGVLSNETEHVQLRFVARHLRSDEEGEGTVINELNLAEGDGTCMAFHGWKEGDFGRAPVAREV